MDYIIQEFVIFMGKEFKKIYLKLLSYINSLQIKEIHKDKKFCPSAIKKDLESKKTLKKLYLAKINLK